jgi:hypothetical protein
MSDLLHCDVACRCGGRTVKPPPEFGNHGWMRCSACGEPLVTWGDYKAAMLAKAAEAIRRRVTSRRVRRG